LEVIHDQHGDAQYLWDRQWWKYLDVLGGARRVDVPNAAAVYDRLVQYAFAGDIAWEHVLQADSLAKAQRGLTLLFDRMARDLSTPNQLQGLLSSMNSAAEQKGATIKFREATGSAGQILEDRVLGRRGARPLPPGWQDVCRPVAGRLPAVGGGYWARRMMAAACHASGSDLRA
jgi:hypothetical protein